MYIAITRAGRQNNSLRHCEALQYIFTVETCLVSGNCAVQEIHGQWRTGHSGLSYGFHRRHLPECSLLSEQQKSQKELTINLLLCRFGEPLNHGPLAPRNLRGYYLRHCTWVILRINSKSFRTSDKILSYHADCNTLRDREILYWRFSRCAIQQ